MNENVSKLNAKEKIQCYCTITSDFKKKQIFFYIFDFFDFLILHQNPLMKPHVLKTSFS